MFLKAILLNWKKAAPVSTISRAIRVYYSRPYGYMVADLNADKLSMDIVDLSFNKCKKFRNNLKLNKHVLSLLAITNALRLIEDGEFSLKEYKNHKDIIFMLLILSQELLVFLDNIALKDEELSLIKYSERQISNAICELEFTKNINDARNIIESAFHDYIVDYKHTNIHVRYFNTVNIANKAINQLDNKDISKELDPFTLAIFATSLFIEEGLMRPKGNAGLDSLFNASVEILETFILTFFTEGKNNYNKNDFIVVTNCLNNTYYRVAKEDDINRTKDYIKSLTNIH